jgi:UDP-hydrolysing UDP-N-acetyl-D-glucosamine 2-epimerase
MRTISVVTGSRADFGIYKPILAQLDKHPEVNLELLVCGMHLSDTYGKTIAEIKSEGYPIAAEIETLMTGDSPRDIAQSMAKGIEGVSEVFEARTPDILVVLGDRYEMFAAACAAVPFAIPLAHIHGGETTEGAIDEAFRHAITKMSHLHFASTEAYGARIVQMGEQPDRVFVSGAPGLDNLDGFVPLSDAELENRIGMSLDPAPLLVTIHPVTLEHGSTKAGIDSLLSALTAIAMPVVFTYPNADTHGQVIIEAITDYVKIHPLSRAVKSLGTQGYFSLLARASAMVGNSSSGIIEAASFELPVVDIGIRQKGRIRGKNCIHAEDAADAIQTAIGKALDPDFRGSLRGMTNPYGDGTAAAKIVNVLASRSLEASLIQKEFYDLSVA